MSYSPDGKYIAFNSNRRGWTGLYYMAIEGGEAQLISDDIFWVSDWFSNNKDLLVSRYSPGYGYKFYKMDLKGNYEVIASYSGSNAHLSKDDSKIIFNRRGYSTRESYQGSVDGELWMCDLKDEVYTRITDNEFTEIYPVFASDKDKIYFAGSDGTLFQLYSMEPGFENTRQQLSAFNEKSVKEIAIAKDKDFLVFTLFDEVWTYNPRLGKSLKLHIDIKEDWIDNEITKEDLHNRFNNFAISPDGKLIVFTYKFDLFAMPAKGGDVKQLTFDQKGIDDIIIAEDNQTIFYSTFNKGIPTLYKTSILDTDDIKPVKWLKNMYVDDIYKIEDNIVVHYIDKDWNRFVAVADSLAEDPVKLPKELTIADRITISNNDTFIWSVRQPGWLAQLHHFDLDSKDLNLLMTNKGGVNDQQINVKENLMFYSRSGNIFRLDLAAKEDFYDEEDNWEEILADEDTEKDTTKTEPEITVDFEDIKLRQKPIVNRLGYNWTLAVTDDSTLVYVNYVDDKFNLRTCNFNGENDKLLKTFKGEINHLNIIRKVTVSIM